MLFLAVKQTISEGITLEEAEAFISALSDCPDLNQKIEILNLILQLIKDKSPGNNTFEGIRAFIELQPFI